MERTVALLKFQKKNQRGEHQGADCGPQDAFDALRHRSENKPNKRRAADKLAKLKESIDLLVEAEERTNTVEDTLN